MGKRTIIAVVLSTIVLLLWYRMNPPKQVQVTPVVEKETAVENIEEEIPSKGEILSLAGKKENKVKQVLVKTRTSEIILSTQGASILSWKIREEEERESVDLVAGEDPQLATFPALVYDVDKDMLELTQGNNKGTVQFRYISDEGLIISKIYTFFYDGHNVELAIGLRNTSEKVLYPEITLNWGPGVGIDKDLFASSKRSMRAVIYKDNKVHKKPKPAEYKNIVWSGVYNQYFLIALISQDRKFPLVSIEKEDKMPVVRISEKVALEAGGTDNIALNIYGGPKEYNSLKAIGKDLEKTSDYGVFAGLSRFMLNILGFFYKLTHNYGWAIVLLTLVVQIPLFPLTAKSFKSMRAMQQLQPQMTQLRQRYKDDPRRLNVEIMNLYKKNKVNPFGGCLPMLLQLPVFWALFTALRNAVELRHAPFIFWIKDLSKADGSGANAAFTFAGEGLPFIGNSLNILVILMGALMFLQQKMSSTDPAQSKMVMFMPIMFTVLFWNFPSGLVLYWIVNSVVTITGQYIIVKKH